VSEPREDISGEDTQEFDFSEELLDALAVAESEEPVVPVYDERLHFRFFVEYNVKAWFGLVLLLVLWFVWQFLASFDMSTSGDASPSPIPTGVEPTDELAQKAAEGSEIVATAVADSFTKFFQEVTPDMSVPVGRIGFWAVFAIITVLLILSARSLVVWRRSRLVVDENGVRLIKPDIPWLLVTGNIQSLNPGIVNDLARTRDFWDLVFFWNCWQATVLCDEQTGEHDQVQNVPVRGVKRLHASINALVANHEAAEQHEGRVTNQLLAEMVEELKLLRKEQQRGEQGSV
jgi:hypothetical protein